MSVQHHSRGSAHGVTSQMLFVLLAGNLFAVIVVLAFRPFPSSELDHNGDLVLSVGMLSLVALGLLFLASAMQRGARGWWIVALALNVAQVGRLVPVVIAVAAWNDGGDVTGLFWAYLFAPFLGLLAAVGVVMTARELLKPRRASGLPLAARTAARRWTSSTFSRAQGLRSVTELCAPNAARRHRSRTTR
jgi:hypothetical protein